jgi:hypothetical protein
MKNLSVKKTTNTPEISFNGNKFIIQGRSITENSFEFYEPVLKWITEYKDNPFEETIVEINLEYFNTSTSKFLIEILKLFKSIQDNNKGKIIIKWCYENDDLELKETGEDFEDLLEIPFEYVEIEEE